MSISSPQPSVVHLLTLFRQIGAGEIRIPAFQRGFVWGESQILDLLNSVNDGFPIGSLLLWSVESETLKIAPGDATTFPDVPIRFPASYVLDGMQRLSALYGVFHFGESTGDGKFNIYYDLIARRFTHAGDFDDNAPAVVPLAALFRPRQLLEQQARISTLPDGDQLIDRLLALQAAFQDYMVPVVTIRGTDLHRIVRVFERINSTGTKLDPVDFMRAITWAEDFDLNVHLDRSVETLASAGLALDPETVIKCVGLVLGIPPTSQGLLELRSQSPVDLSRAFESAVSILSEISNLLAERLGIHSSSLVPYEGVLLVFFKALGLERAGSELGLLLRWFWSVGFNESLRGKPDHYITRALENWRGLIRGEVRGLEPRLRISPREFTERRLVSGKALSATFAAMFASSRAKNFRNGEIIQPGAFLTKGYADYFRPVVSTDELRAHSSTPVVSARVFSNLVLTDGVELQSELNVRRILLDLADRGEWDVLRSQYITSDAIDALRSNDTAAFLADRELAMWRQAECLVDGQT